MHSVSALACGIRGAENGYADVLTLAGALATCYSDINGTVLGQGTSGIPLDENGSVIVYVDALVEIVAKDSDGIELRRFHDGVAASAVVVRSPAFVGTDYDDAETGVGKPISLTAVFALLLASFGTTNFNVLANGSAERIQDVLGAVSGIFYNVKSPEFGAQGDGVSDDTAPIQAAIDAASAAGGGIVFFPNSTYLLTGVTVKGNVSLLGVGSQSVLAVNHASNPALSFNTSIVDAAPVTVRGIALGTAQAHTGALVSVTTLGQRRVVFDGVLIGDASHTGDCIDAQVGASGAHELAILNSVLSVYGETGHAVDAQNSTRIILSNTECVCKATTFNSQLLNVRNLKTTQSKFSLAAMTTGTAVCILLGGAVGAGPVATITGNEFIPGSATDACMQLSNANEATTNVAESGNSFIGGVAGWDAVYSGWGIGSQAPRILAASRPAHQAQVTSNVTPLALDTQYGGLVLIRTTTAAQTLTASLGPEGAHFTLTIHNSSGAGSGTESFGTGFGTSTTIGTFADNFVATLEFVSVLANGTLRWMPVAAVGVTSSPE